MKRRIIVWAFETGNSIAVRLDSSYAIEQILECPASSNRVTPVTDPLLVEDARRLLPPPEALAAAFEGFDRFRAAYHKIPADPHLDLVLSTTNQEDRDRDPRACFQNAPDMWHWSLELWDSGQGREGEPRKTPLWSTFLPYTGPRLDQDSEPPGGQPTGQLWLNTLLAETHVLEFPEGLR